MANQTILTPNQIKLLEIFSKDSGLLQNFYLTGGTALSAFYLHHRLSQDLDFFTEQEVDTAWLTAMVTKITKGLAVKTVDRRVLFNRNLIFFNFQNDTAKTEFTYFPSPTIEKPKLFAGLPVDSLTDIAVNKFFTVYQKPAARHFIDLYLILSTKNYTWNQLSKLARIKFDTNIDPLQLGSQLVKAENISDLPKMLVDLPEKRWRNYFLSQAKSLKKLVGH